GQASQRLSARGVSQERSPSLAGARASAGRGGRRGAGQGSASGRGGRAGAWPVGGAKGRPASARAPGGEGRGAQPVAQEQGPGRAGERGRQGGGATPGGG